MFAISDRSTKRRIAGCLGGVLGASLLLLTAYPGIAAAAPVAPTLDKLTLTSVCTLPHGDVIFRVGNSNALAVTYTWDINKTSFVEALRPRLTATCVCPSHRPATRVPLCGRKAAGIVGPERQGVRAAPPAREAVARCIGRDAHEPDGPEGLEAHAGQRSRDAHLHVEEGRGLLRQQGRRGRQGRVHE